MGDLIKIAIQAGLDENAVFDIEKQVEDVQKHVKPIKISGDFDKVQV